MPARKRGNKVGIFCARGGKLEIIFLCLSDSLTMSFDVHISPTCTSEDSLNRILASLSDKLDFSNVSQDHILYDGSKLCAPGAWKCELGLLEKILLFCSVRAKNYGMVLARRGLSLPVRFRREDGEICEEYDDEDGDCGAAVWDSGGCIGAALAHALSLKDGEVLSDPLEFRQKLKGVPRRWTKELNPSVYKKAATSAHYETVSKQKNFRTLAFRIYTVRTENRLAVSSLDVKRYVLRCSRHSLALGHKDIPELAERGDPCSICEEEQGIWNFFLSLMLLLPLFFFQRKARGESWPGGKEMASADFGLAREIEGGLLLLFPALRGEKRPPTTTSWWKGLLLLLLSSPLGTSAA